MISRRVTQTVAITIGIAATVNQIITRAEISELIVELVRVMIIITEDVIVIGLHGCIYQISLCHLLYN